MASTPQNVVGNSNSVSQKIGYKKKSKKVTALKMLMKIIQSMWNSSEYADKNVYPVRLVP